MKKLMVLALALATLLLPADLASARGGRGGGGRGGRGAGPGGRGGRGQGPRRRNRDKRKNLAVMRDRADQENRDAILRDARDDSV